MKANGCQIPVDTFQPLSILVISTALSSVNSLFLQKKSVCSWLPLYHTHLVLLVCFQLVFWIFHGLYPACPLNAEWHQIGHYLWKVRKFEWVISMKSKKGLNGSSLNSLKLEYPSSHIIRGQDSLAWATENSSVSSRKKCNERWLTFGLQFCKGMLLAAATFSEKS